MNDYREKLIEKYFSSHHQYIMPKTKEEWEWVIWRIELNFGKIFATLPVNAKILDIGCGLGYLEYYLLKKGFNNIEAIDLSEEQVEKAKNNLRQFDSVPNGKVSFAIADVFSYLEKVKEEKSYNLIAGIDLIDHLRKEEVFKLLEFVYIVLQQSGLLILRATNMNNPLSSQYFYSDFTHETGFTVSSISQCLRSAGFKIKDVFYENVPPFPERKKTLITRVKRFITPVRPYLLGKLFRIDPRSLSENLVVIAQK